MDARIEKATIAGYGGKYIASTDATAPDDNLSFIAIQVIATAVITLVGNITGITTVTVATGTVIYGRYSSITLASGSVIAYHGV